MSRAGKYDTLIPTGLDIFAGMNVACEIAFHVSRLMLVGGKALKVISYITSGKSMRYYNPQSWREINPTFTSSIEYLICMEISLRPLLGEDGNREL